MKTEKITPSELIGSLPTKEYSVSLGAIGLWLWVWSIFTATHASITYIDTLIKGVH